MYKANKQVVPISGEEDQKRKAKMMKNNNHFKIEKVDSNR